jgi:hypothetical protein
VVEPVAAHSRIVEQPEPNSLHVTSALSHTIALDANHSKTNMIN